ncbi:hypothetical protein SAMN05216340_12342, partial [Megamonas sp. Calf98-2]
MEFRQLESFCAVVHYQSFTKCERKAPKFIYG